MSERDTSILIGVFKLFTVVGSKFNSRCNQFCWGGKTFPLRKGIASTESWSNPTPGRLKMVIPKLTILNQNLNLILNSKFSFNAVRINDKGSLSNEEREEQLISLFRENDFDLSFIGEY